MKIMQQSEPKFEPIAIVLETAYEANILWSLVSVVRRLELGGNEVDEEIRKMAIKISNYFGNEAKF